MLLMTGVTTLPHCTVSCSAVASEFLLILVSSIWRMESDRPCCGQKMLNFQKENILIRSLVVCTLLLTLQMKHKLNKLEGIIVMLETLRSLWYQRLVIWFQFPKQYWANNMFPISFNLVIWSATAIPVPTLQPRCAMLWVNAMAMESAASQLTVPVSVTKDGLELTVALRSPLFQCNLWAIKSAELNGFTTVSTHNHLRSSAYKFPVLKNSIYT